MSYNKFQQCLKIKQITKNNNTSATINILNRAVINRLQLIQNNKFSIKLKNQMIKSGNLVSKNQLKIIRIIQLTIQTISIVQFIYQIYEPKQSIKNNKVAKSQFLAKQFLQIYNRLLQHVKQNQFYFIKLWRLQQKLQNKLLSTEQNSINYQRKIIQLQKQQNQHKNTLLQNKKIKQIKKQCQICMVQIQTSDIGYLDFCKHMFHRSCITDYIKNSLNNGNIDIKCPMENCQQKFSPNDIQIYIQGKDIIKYYNLQKNKYVQSNNQTTIYCFTPSCPAVLQHNNQYSSYQCPICKKQYCIECQDLFHEGITCQKNKENRKAQQLENQKKSETFKVQSKYKQCPHCKIWVQKKEGCVSIKCRCGKQFCYNCGGTDCPHGNCKLKLNKLKVRTT